MNKDLTDRDIHQQCSKCSKFDVEVPEEAWYILWCIRKENDPDYPFDACISALSEDKELYKALKDARGHRPDSSIRNSTIDTDASIEANVQSLLAELQPAMKKLVEGKIILPLWSPTNNSLDPETFTHLVDLKIPCVQDKPNLLIHDLGSFTSDRILERRLHNIFMPNNHTFLVNTSGSGKTRLLLEGLCENWGFYFTSLVDSSDLGSHDVQNSIQKHVPDAPGFQKVLPPAESADYQAALKTNRAIAGRIFRRIFLARLFIFNLFVKTMNDVVKGNEADDPGLYRARWLLLQLQPASLHLQVPDVFDKLSSKLSKATDSFINTKTKTLLTTARSLCSYPKMGVSTTPIQMSTSNTAQTPIFCVLDEAQHAATQHCSSFRSDQNGARRPILREIVKAWEGQSFGQGVFMVVAGTGISKDVVDQAMASAIMKDSRYRWCSDTGAFDRKEVQQRYLMKYLPPSLLKSDAGRRLVERVWYWLHGRYRFTAGYVSELLQNGFRRPHGLLNAYIKHFTKFVVTDALSFTNAEGGDALPDFSQYTLDFSKLEKNSNMLTTIHQLTTHYLMRSVLPFALEKDEAIYVEYGFARFVDSETKTVAVDEPLVLLSATRWIDKNYKSNYRFFAQQVHLHNPSSDLNGFENYLAFCIDMVFSVRRRVDEVFQFSGPSPPWSKLEAELVGLQRADFNLVEQSAVRHWEFSGPSVTLGTDAKSAEKIFNWLQHDSYTPICFPHASMGPDLLFILRLSDHSCIWVALQAKYSLGKKGLLSRRYLRDSMRSVTPSFFFLDKNGKQFSPASHPTLIDETNKHLMALPHRRSDAGKYSLLRVVASFPAATNLKRCLEEDPDKFQHPIASLNMEFLKQVTQTMSLTAERQGLQGHLEDPPRDSGKRKRRRESTPTKGHPKKIKLKI